LYRTALGIPPCQVSGSYCHTMLTFRRSSGEMKWSASAAALSVVLHR
jgi:hypothetical protein